MKLYYSPAACSLAPHIVLKELGAKFEAEKVDLASKKTAGGGDFTKVNPLGYVPAVTLDDGQTLTEASVIVQYLADQKPEAGLAPRNGTMERVRMQEWLNFIAGELHKGIGQLFNPKMPDDYKAVVKDKLQSRFAHLEKHFAKQPYLLGQNYSVADAYAFTILNWTNFTKVSLDAYPNVKAYMGRIASRPKVLEALKAEGLVK